ncbi:UNVERIFIED_CONTAM: hypothetical protein Sindi_0466000, partial [Sesamum indicum]
LPEMEDQVYKVYPLAILAGRLIPRNNVGVPQVLIHRILPLNKQPGKITTPGQLDFLNSILGDKE